MRRFKDVSTEKWALWVSVTALCLSVVTCLLVLLFMVEHTQKDVQDTGYLKGRVDSVHQELNQIRSDNLERERRLRAEFQAETELLRQDHDIEALRAQALRERLIKKGWIE